uniref:tRNA (guanine(46)-N(7))-methyltransferase n=1 Tax=Inonotus obliquus TaxID=167356 RepID=A0A345BJX7_9AGAM|nr:SAM-dependent methyltransferase [Inonotus obliquus]
MSVKVTGVHSTQGLRDLFGRGMNSDLYKLPADKQEMDRLSLQHRIWKLMADGLYPKEADAAIRRVLHRTKGDSNPPMILDIGSGSGTWAVEMAQKFPHAEVVGMDLIQSTPRLVRLHEHSLLTQKFIKVGHQFCPVELHAEILALVTSVFTENLETYKLARTGNDESEDRSQRVDHSWFARWMFEVTERWTTRAQQNTDGDKLHILIDEDGHFEEAQKIAYWSPIGWDGQGIVSDTVKGAEIGRLMVLNVFDFLQASKPSLLASGLSKEVVESWVKNVQAEAINPAKHMLLKWAITWATKRP